MEECPYLKREEFYRQWLGKWGFTIRETLEWKIHQGITTLHMEHLAQVHGLTLKGHTSWAWHWIPPPNSTAAGLWRVKHVQSLTALGTHIDMISRRENGAMCKWNSCQLPAIYLFVSNTLDKTVSTQTLWNLEKIFGVAQPTALQMSFREALFTGAQQPFLGSN